MPTELTYLSTDIRLLIEVSEQIMGLIKTEFVVIDPGTGERREGFPVWIPVKPKLKEGFFIAMQDGFIRLAKESDLTGEDLKVLLI
jgi:hypothetical protein